VVSAAGKISMNISQKKWASAVGSALGLSKPRKAKESARHAPQQREGKTCPDCGNEMERAWHGWDCFFCHKFFTDAIMSVYS